MKLEKRMFMTILLVLMSAVLAIGVTACASDDSEVQEEGADTADEPSAEVDPVRQLIETKCSMCHSTDRVWAVAYDREVWVTTLERMETNGLVLADEERQQIIDYLASE